MNRGEGCHLVHLAGITRNHGIISEDLSSLYRPQHSSGHKLECMEHTFLVQKKLLLFSIILAITYTVKVIRISVNWSCGIAVVLLYCRTCISELYLFYTSVCQIGYCFLSQFLNTAYMLSTFLQTILTNMWRQHGSVLSKLSYNCLVGGRACDNAIVWLLLLCYHKNRVAGERAAVRLCDILRDQTIIW